MGQGRERLALLVLTALQMSHLLDFMVLTPLGPQLMRVFGITPTQVGLFVTVYTLSAALASLLSAFVIDRFDRKRALLWVYGGFLLSALASALAPSYALLLLARVLAGAFGGLLTGIVLAIVSDVVPEVRRGRALGMVMSAFAVSSIVFLPLCLWLGSHYSWRGAYGAVLLRWRPGCFPRCARIWHRMPPQGVSVDCLARHVRCCVMPIIGVRCCWPDCLMRRRFRWSLISVHIWCSMPGWAKPNSRWCISPVASALCWRCICPVVWLIG